MGNKKKKEEPKGVVVEYRVSMHCNACERTVAQTISKYEGVETFTTDMNTQKVVVTGRVDPQKLLKKLKKKTGKRVEILVKEKDDDDDTCNGGGGLIPNLHPTNTSAWPPLFADCEESEVLLFIFSEENPNACAIM